MIYVCNAFSLGMVPRDLLTRVRIEPLPVRPVLDGLIWKSAVGHADTARLLGVPMARVSVTMAPDDLLMVAQYQGQRLPEGTTELPEGASFAWVKVHLQGAPE